MRKAIEGGYVLAQAGQLTQAWEWYRSGLLKLADLRVYLACREMVARRCKAKVSRYDLDEVSRLTGLRRPRASLTRLQDAGLLRFDEGHIDVPPAAGRLVPVPRRMLRFLARCQKPSLIAAVFGHLLRCLFYARGEVRNGGRCKAAALASQFDVDLRRLKAARAELVELGWLVRIDEPQWRLNSGGGSYRINLAWSEMPPRPVPAGTELPPPDSDKDPLPGSKNQEPRTGVSIHDIKPEDLKDTGRTLELHAQAVKLGAVTDSEAGRLRVVAAAEHALAVATTNAPGLFATILRDNLFRFLTQDDEDAARRRIREHLYPPSAPAEPRINDDARLAREVVAAARRAGFKGDPFYVLRQQGWTRPRWEAAIHGPGSGFETSRGSGPASTAPRPRP